ncbi:MAG: hypothetical protein FJ207_15045 [Gemmatimonadetes bacterium]|nr:hypothetical protein [Gemmatimonadota bacterium]
MTKQETMVKAIEGRITWIQAADILGITARHMHRIKTRYKEFGLDALRDHRAGQPRRRRIPLATVEKLSYTCTLLTLQAAGLAEKAPARGKYRRRRERRPMRGMLLHLDASTHARLGEDRPMATIKTGEVQPPAALAGGALRLRASMCACSVRPILRFLACGYVAIVSGSLHSRRGLLGR